MAAQLFIPSDGSADGALIDSATGAITAGAITFFSLSGAARLPNGVFALSNSSGLSPLLIWQWNGGASFTQLATCAAGNTTGGIKLAAIGTNFWTPFDLNGTATNTPTFKKFDQTGAILKSVGPITFLVNGVNAFTPSLDETIAYYNNGVDNSAIKRWDLVNNLALTNLVANLGNADTSVENLWPVPSSTDIIAILVKWTGGTDGGTRLIRRYTSTGTIVYTVTFATVAGTASDISAVSAIDPVLSSVWVRWPGPPDYDTSLSSSFSLLRFSDGATVSSVHTPTVAGVPGTTCPLLVLEAATTTTTYPIRRLRQTAHLSTEQVWLFFSKFQLDCEAGVGLSTGQGSDPQVMLSWSSDGGHTWSPEQWMSAGLIGEYSRRVIWRRLGRSRDRVWKLVVSDPVAWRLLAAYVDVSKGTS